MIEEGGQLRIQLALQELMAAGQPALRQVAPVAGERCAGDVAGDHQVVHPAERVEQGGERALVGREAPGGVERGEKFQRIAQALDRKSVV